MPFKTIRYKIKLSLFYQICAFIEYDSNDLYDLGSKALSSYSDGQANSTVLILCFVLLFVFAIAATALILCLFTKCKKAHTKLLKRTLLAKNNSYKTAPGGKLFHEFPPRNYSLFIHLL